MDFQVDFFLNKIKWRASVGKLHPSSIQHVTGMNPIGAGTSM